MRNSSLPQGRHEGISLMIPVAAPEQDSLEIYWMTAQARLIPGSLV
jgi:hypothetical protein